MSSPVEALPSNILVRSAISLKPQRLAHPARIAIDVGAQLQLARLIHIGREIFEMNRQRLRQIDIALLAADEFLDPLLVPAWAQNRYGKGERIIDPHAAMAERPL